MLLKCKKKADLLGICHRWVQSTQNGATRCLGAFDINTSKIVRHSDVPEMEPQKYHIQIPCVYLSLLEWNPGPAEVNGTAVGPVCHPWFGDRLLCSMMWFHLCHFFPFSQSQADTGFFFCSTLWWSIFYDSWSFKEISFFTFPCVWDAGLESLPVSVSPLSHSWLHSHSSVGLDFALSLPISTLWSLFLNLGRLCKHNISVLWFVLV